MFSVWQNSAFNLNSKHEPSGKLILKYQQISMLTLLFHYIFLLHLYILNNWK